MASLDEACRSGLSVDETDDPIAQLTSSEIITNQFREKEHTCDAVSVLVRIGNGLSALRRSPISSARDLASPSRRAKHIRWINCANGRRAKYASTSPYERVRETFDNLMEKTYRW
jgi:hypothetical protein